MDDVYNFLNFLVHILHWRQHGKLYSKVLWMVLYFLTIMAWHCVTITPATFKQSPLQGCHNVALWELNEYMSLLFSLPLCMENALNSSQAPPTASPGPTHMDCLESCSFTLCSILQSHCLDFESNSSANSLTVLTTTGSQWASPIGGVINFVWTEAPGIKMLFHIETAASIMGQLLMHSLIILHMYVLCCLLTWDNTLTASQCWRTTCQLLFSCNDTLEDPPLLVCLLLPLPLCPRH